MCGSFKSERENELTGHNSVYIHDVNMARDLEEKG